MPNQTRYRPSNWKDHAIIAILEARPSSCTGFYVSAYGVTFGHRTNREKAPKNFIFFDSPSLVERAAMSKRESEPTPENEVMEEPLERIAWTLENILTVMQRN